MNKQKSGINYKGPEGLQRVLRVRTSYGLAATEPPGDRRHATEEKE